MPRGPGDTVAVLPGSRRQLALEVGQGVVGRRRGAIQRGFHVEHAVIVGGGYHGKSTILRALERGVYPHVPGDGRELVATVPDAVKVRAADGRAVTGVDPARFLATRKGEA